MSPSPPPPLLLEEEKDEKKKKSFWHGKVGGGKGAGDRTGMSFEEAKLLSPRAPSPVRVSPAMTSPTAVGALVVKKESLLSRVLSPRSKKESGGPLSPRMLMPIKQEHDDGDGEDAQQKHLSALASTAATSGGGIIKVEEEETNGNNGRTVAADGAVAPVAPVATAIGAMVAMDVDDVLVVKKEEDEPDGEPEDPETLGVSMSYHPLEEDPEWSLFLPFDSLEFSFIGGCLSVCRPVPDEFVAEYRSILEMVIPVIQHTTKIKKIFLGEKKLEVFIVDRPLKQREATAKEHHNYGQYACPIEDLRLADQMVRIALVGRPRNYSYWHLQYYLREAVSKILGRKDDKGVIVKQEEEAGKQARGTGGTHTHTPTQTYDERDEVENDAIVAKIEAMTGTRILVAPFDPSGYRRCFLLMGEEELITRALNLLSGAITQRVEPSRQNIHNMLALHGGEPPEKDTRLDQIREELKVKHSLKMIEMRRDGNCLFRALSVYEHKTESKHKEMRGVVIKRLEEASDAMEVTALVENITPQEYLRRMAEDGQWGGYTEIMAYSEALKRNVRLFVENERIGLRPTDIECPEGAVSERVQLLLYKSHYWLLKST